MPVLRWGPTSFRMETECGEVVGRDKGKGKEKVPAGRESQNVLTPRLMINNYSNRRRKFSRARHSVKGTCAKIESQM